VLAMRNGEREWSGDTRARGSPYNCNQRTTNTDDMHAYLTRFSQNREERVPQSVLSWRVQEAHTRLSAARGVCRRHTHGSARLLAPMAAEERAAAEDWLGAEVGGVQLAEKTQGV